MKQIKKGLCGILALTMCISVMTGCAANPDRGSVTSKNDGVFEQNMTVAATAPLDEQLLHTETFTSTDGTAEYTIHFDQELKSDPLPIVEVVPHFFTGEDVKRVAHALFGDVDFYEREHEDDPEYSKEQLQKRINWMTELATPEALRELYGGEEYVEDTLELLKFFIQQYTVQLETAPVENPHTPCEWTFKEDKHYASSYNAYGNDWLVATVDLGEVNYHGTEAVYVNAHGTGTPLNDVGETKAIKKALGEQQAYKALVSSTKSMTGHMLGAAGAIEAIVCLKVLKTGIVPPTINLLEPDPQCDLNYVPNQAVRANIDLCVSNSLGFGGHNACLAFRKV